MFSRTRAPEEAEKNASESPLAESPALSPKESALESVNEKWFALYEWISPEELRMTLERDYIQIVRFASIPLAIVTGIAAFVGLIASPIGSILAILLVLGIFYGIVGLVLAIRFFHRSYVYVRGANVVITDNHYVLGGKVIEKSDEPTVRKRFERFENMFDEPFFGESRIKEKKAKAKTQLFDNLKLVAAGWEKIIRNIGQSRDSKGVVIVILIAGFLYAAMMGLVYFIGIFFISIFGRIFAWLAHRYLLATSNTEHVIQSLFREIDRSAKRLETEKKSAVRLLDSATQNEWKDNLSGKINASTKLLGELAGSATDDSRKLRSLLESSEYKEIFNFVKYGNWVSKQILEPIESIISLLRKNHSIISENLVSLDSQIATTPEPAFQLPLEAQKKRFQMQLENFESTIRLLEGYEEKLK